MEISIEEEAEWFKRRNKWLNAECDRLNGELAACQSTLTTEMQAHAATHAALLREQRAHAETREHLRQETVAAHLMHDRLIELETDRDQLRAECARLRAELLAYVESNNAVRVENG